MPTVSKQTRTAANGRKLSPTVARGGILSRAVPVNEVTTKFVKMVIYGNNRTGKTTLACQFPKPLLLISFEPGETGGSLSVNRIPGVEFLQVTTTAEAEQLAEELRGNDRYATHVLDGAANWERMHMADVLGIDPNGLTEQLGRAAHGGISRDQYTDRTERMKNQLRKFLNLHAHTVLLCREKDHSPPKDQFKPKMLRGFELESFFASDLSGGTVGWLHDAFDYVGRIYLDREIKQVKTLTKFQGKEIEKIDEVETGKYVRRLRTLYHPNMAAGFRSNRPNDVPEFVEGPTPKAMYERIMKLIQGE